ncbi:TPA: hypothetical protein MFX66_26560 [Klebsiella pneumoniae]|nr:hypothetical protein [Klebsiella pneumoniae]HBW9943468.1 hypothetical protein [Klebsiella pneumoniae]
MGYFPFSKRTPIRWHVVDAVGQDIRPLEKTFHNACQESYWLKVNRQTHLPV